MNTMSCKKIGRSCRESAPDLVQRREAMQAEPPLPIAPRHYLSVGHVAGHHFHALLAAQGIGILCGVPVMALARGVGTQWGSGRSWAA